MVDSVEIPRKRHHGKNLQKIRVYLGMKQETLASEIGISRQAVSKIEQQEIIEDELLEKLANVLEVSPDMIKTFDDVNATYNINNNNYRDATINEGATPIVQQINPIEKIIELYERLLKSERENNQLKQSGPA